MSKTNLRKTFWKTWNFLTHEDSWQSFLADAILVLLIGKFILFPGLGLMLGNEFPVVAVISGSMDHNNEEFGEWWLQKGSSYARYNISEEMFENFYVNNGFEKGDVLVIKRVPVDELHLGDVTVYSVPQRKDPIIHRIVSMDPISTQGDSNSGQISFEIDISEENIHGKAIALVPYIGWVKVGAVQLFS